MEACRNECWYFLSSTSLVWRVHFTLCTHERALYFTLRSSHRNVNSLYGWPELFAHRGIIFESKLLPFKKRLLPLVPFVQIVTKGTGGNCWFNKEFPSIFHFLLEKSCSLEIWWPAVWVPPSSFCLSSCHSGSPFHKQSHSVNRSVPCQMAGCWMLTVGISVVISFRSFLSLELTALFPFGTTELRAVCTLLSIDG